MKIPAAALALALLASPSPAADTAPARPKPTAAGESEPASKRIKQLVALSGKGEPAASAFRTALKDSRPPVRAAAVQLLAKESGASAVGVLGPMVDDADESVAIAAVGALAAMRGDATLPYLRRALKSPSTRVRSQTLAYLGDAKDTRLITEIAAVVSDADPSVRRTAIETLEALGSPQGFPFLMSATADAVPANAVAAVRALVSLGDARALPRVVALADTPSVELRIQVALAVSSLGGFATHRAVVEALEKDPQRDVRRALAVGARDHPTAASIPFLRRRAQDPEPPVRRMVAQALKVNPDPAASEILVSLLGDQAPDIRATALLALGARKASDRLGAMTALGGDPATPVRAALALALGEIGSPETLPTLERLVKDSAVEVRAGAAGSAGRVPSAKSLQVLDVAMADTDPSVRSMAVRSLGVLAVDGASERLRKALTTETTPEVRLLVIQQLESRKDRQALPQLRKLAQSPVETIRSAAARAVRTIEASAPPPATP